MESIPRAGGDFEAVQQWQMSRGRIFVAWQELQEGQTKETLPFQKGEIGKKEKGNRSQISPNYKENCMRSWSSRTLLLGVRLCPAGLMGQRSHLPDTLQGSAHPVAILPQSFARSGWDLKALGSPTPMTLAGCKWGDSSLLKLRR